MASTGWMTVLRRYWVLAFMVIAVQCALQAIFFPWSGLTNHVRLNHIDAPFHLYQIVLARDLCSEGMAVGYDPRFGAGHVGGVTFNASAKVPAALACALPGDVDANAIYKQVSFWSGVIAPSLVVVACAFVGMPLMPTVLAAVFGLLLWWTGALRWYHTAGMVSWVFACYCTVAFVSAFARVGHVPGGRRLLWLGLAAALGFLVHPLFAVASALLGVIWVVWVGLRDANLLRRCGAALLVGGMMVLAAWAWLIPSIGSAQGFASVLTPYQRAVDPWLAIRELSGTAPTAAGGSRLYLALLLGAGLCLWLVRGPLGVAMAGLSLGSALLMAWASLGGLSLRIGLLQPNRFSALAWLALALPAAAGIHEAWRRSLGASGIRRVLGMAGVAVIFALPAYFLREAWREALAPPGTARYGVQPPEVKGAGPIEEALVTYLDRSQPDDSRVYFENSLGRVHDGGHVAGMVALRSGRALIGGPYPFTLFATGWDGSAFQRPIAEITSQQLTGLLDAYNVRLMLCHSAGCKLAMSRVADLVATQQLGPVTAYERKSSPGYVAQGEAKVELQCTNRVEVGQVKSHRVILRFQWVPGLRAVPSGKVTPVSLDPDLPPFVAVDDAPYRFALRLGSGDGIPCGKRPRSSQRRDG